MNTSTEKIKAELAEKLETLFGKVIRKDQVDTVDKYIDHYIKAKGNGYYRKDLKHISNSMVDLVRSLKEVTEDSRAEAIFYNLLFKKKIPFKFQYKIGQFRADFLISDTLVFEIDGPMHYLNKEYDERRDKYIKRMGYEIMHVPLLILMISPELVIDEIRERLSKLATGVLKSME